MSKSKKDYAALTEAYLRLNGLQAVRAPDYLGVERLRLVRPEAKPRKR